MARQTNEPMADPDAVRTDINVELLNRIVDKKHITIEAWAADHKLGRSTQSLEGGAIRRHAAEGQGQQGEGRKDRATYPRGCRRARASNSDRLGLTRTRPSRRCMRFWQRNAAQGRFDFPIPATVCFGG